MKFVPLILHHLRRNWIRTSSTIVAMTVCIFLFCTLQTFLKAVNWNLQSASSNRLIVRHRVSMVFNIPVAYKARIQSVPGVQSVVAANWFGGVFRDMKNFFPNMAVEPEGYLAMYPEFQLPEDQKKAWFADRRGCIIGRRTADRFHFKIGDTIAMESFIPPYRIGKPWEFVVRGIYDSDPVRYPGTDLTMMYFKWDYLYETLHAIHPGSSYTAAGTFYVQIADASKAGEVSKAIDDLFENSDTQTRTETESAFRAGFLAMVGNLALLLNSIAIAVMFTILLVVANTMSMAVRERRSEIAVLKTLGFSSGLIMLLIMGEAMAIGLIGGGLGILLGHWAIQALPSVPFLGDAVRGFPELGLTLPTAAIGLGTALALSLAAGIIPAWLAYRARITEMLRQI
jgi:putative ABC transport system permease protein